MKSANKNNVPQRKDAVIRFYFEHSQIYTLFEELIHKPWGYQVWQPAVDVIERGDAFIIKADLPNVDPADIIVRVSQTRLLLEGRRRLDEDLANGDVWVHERPHGIFYRQIECYTTLDPDSVRKHFDEGVLTITVKKRQQSNQENA